MILDSRGAWLMVCYSLYVMVLEMLMDFDIDQERQEPSLSLPAQRLRYFSWFLSADYADTNLCDAQAQTSRNQLDHLHPSLHSRQLGQESSDYAILVLRPTRLHYIAWNRKVEISS